MRTRRAATTWGWMNERGWMEMKRTEVQKKTEMKRTTLMRTVLTTTTLTRGRRRRGASGDCAMASDAQIAGQTGSP
jgi:hypothetical protein